MPKKSVRNKCKTSNSVVYVEPGNSEIPPKKYLKVRNFKDLQAEEFIVGDNLEKSSVNMESEPRSRRKRQAKDDIIIVEEASQDKQIKIEIKLEVEDGATLSTQTRSEFVKTSQKPGGASSIKLSSVQVLGHELFYRHHGSMVLFKTSSLMKMLSSSLPLVDTSHLENVVDKSGGGQSVHLLEDSWKRAFISWNALRGLLNGGLLDLAIRDLLLSARVEGIIESDIQCEQQVSRCNSTQDNLEINMIEVKFKVRGGTVYLEVLSAFTALDRLGEALESSWSKVDQELAAQGMSLKAAFKKRGAGRNSGIEGGLSRNYMTLEAFCIICQGHKSRDRVEKLVMMVTKLKDKEKSICKEIQQTVDMILRTSCIAPGQRMTPASLSTPEDGESQLGHKYCDNSLCGRGYHFVMKCCGKSHVLRLGGQDIGFVRKQGRIFLEKCAAFGVLGRMYVIRCSDYRKTDKILLEKGDGESVDSNFLFEHDDINLGRNRRTHISLDAFISLVHAGFADPSKTETLVSSMELVRREYQDNKRDTCEDMEVIDLSGSDIEVEDNIKTVSEESSSGIESEECSPLTPRRMMRNAEVESDDFDIDSGTVGEFVEIFGAKIPIKTVDNKLFMEKTAILQLVDSPTLLQKGHRAIDKLLEENGVCLDDSFLYEGRQRGFVSSTAIKILLQSELLQEFEQKEGLILEILKLENSVDSLKDSQILSLKSFDNIRFRIVGGTVHLDSQKLLKLAGFSSSYVYQAPSKANLLLCKILSDRGVNTSNCFVKYGKSKYAFISLPAAHTLLRSESGPLKDSTRTRKLTEEIFDALRSQGVLKDVPDVAENGIKVLEGFPSIRFKVNTGRLFLHRKSCFECLGLESAVLSSKKGYSAINNILMLGGLDITSCYIATKQQKYSYISCLALVLLLQSRDPLMVCLKNKEQFLEGLLGTLQAGAVAVLDTSNDLASLQLDGDVSIKIQVKGSAMFLQRHTAYTLAGLYDQADWSSCDIYDDPTGPLAERGVDLETAFLSDEADRFAWLSLHSLFVLMVCGAGLEDGGGNNYQTVAWRDLLSAVAQQEPRLRNHLKMDNFKTILLKKVMSLYIEFLGKDKEVSVAPTSSLETMDAESGVDSGTDSGHGSAAGLLAVKNIPATEDEMEQVENETESSIGLSGLSRFTALNSKDPVSTLSIVPHATAPLPLLSPEQQVPDSAPCSPQVSSNLHSPSTSCAPSPSTSCLPSPTGSFPDETWSTSTSPFLTPDRYSKLVSDILASAGGVGGHIGDWEVTESTQVMTKLSVRPGYGASRKGSFLHPDYAAILRYSLTLGQDTWSLTINEQEINSQVLNTILDRGEKEGTLSFLYQLISLRPCFGSFAPELVETVSQSLERKDRSKDIDELLIDSSFIGTSSSGRTYAGTVRSKQCDFLAADRVSDCCIHCKSLDRLTINRSILGQEEAAKAKDSDESEGGKTGHKSVWQLATTSEDGCSFLCPQVQSFNTSLPHAFDGSAQATSIVNHRVEISNNLKVQLELSDRVVNMSFPEFQKSRQLGPLLDLVAGLRLCVGYPNMQLVKQATFIINNMDRIKPELRKLFKFLSVDDKFQYESDRDQAGAGTIRAVGCQVTAETGADICHQCRLLQEPIEFLSA